MNDLTRSLLPNTDKWTQEQYDHQARRRVTPWSEALLIEAGWTRREIAALPNNAEALVELWNISKGIDNQE